MASLREFPQSAEGNVKLPYKGPSCTLDKLRETSGHPQATQSIIRERSNLQTHPVPILIASSSIAQGLLVVRGWVIG